MAITSSFDLDDKCTEKHLGNSRQRLIKSFDETNVLRSTNAFSSSSSPQTKKIKRMIVNAFVSSTILCVTISTLCCRHRNQTHHQAAAKLVMRVCLFHFDFANEMHENIRILFSERFTTFLIV